MNHRLLLCVPSSAMLPWRSSSHSSYNLALVSLQVVVLWMSSWLTLGAARDLAFIINHQVIPEDTSKVTEAQGVQLVIGCGYRGTVHKSEVSLYHTDVTPDVSLQIMYSEEIALFSVLSYTVSAADATGNRGYRCESRSTRTGVTIVASMTIHFSDSPTTDTPSPDSPAIDTTSPTTDSTSTPDSPATDTTSPTTDSTSGGTSSGNTDTPKTPFKGLKPLIYTVASVVLLGTLAIVAIITCWIRARRSFQNRVMRPNNTPQDYLDYINDNEFTPLTTSEFLASLQERPPTYNQSEEMIQQTGEGDDSTSTTAGASSSSTAATGTGSANQSSETQDTSTRRGEGTLADRRRERRRERQRRVVIVEAGSSSGGASGQNEQSGGSTAPAHQEPSRREGGSAAQGDTLEQTGNADQLHTSRGRETNGRDPPQQTVSGASTGSQREGGEDVGTAETGRVGVLVDLEMPSEPSAMPRSAHAPTQREIEEIEARVSMLEVLSSPPFNSQSQHILSSAEISPPSVNTGGGGGGGAGLSNDNLIDFLDPSNSTVPPSSDF